jgi:hypothetical protein
MMEAAYLDAISKTSVKLAQLADAKASLYFIMYRPYNGRNYRFYYVRRY